MFSLNVSRKMENSNKIFCVGERKFGRGSKGVYIVDEGLRSKSIYLDTVTKHSKFIYGGLSPW